MIFISLLSLFAIVSSQALRQPACANLQGFFEFMCPNQDEDFSLVSLQGRPGKRGPIGHIGRTGSQGIRGEKGSSGEADYDRVEEMISERIQEIVDNQTLKYNEIFKLLTEAKENILLLENKAEEQRIDVEANYGRLEESISRRIQGVSNEQTRRYTAISTSLNGANRRVRILENKHDSCPMKYDGKCFWIEYYSYSKITIAEARAICSARGGRLADIYSETHHYMLLRYLRMFGRSSDGWAEAWIALTCDTQTNAVFLSDGTRAPYVKWYSGYPQSSYTSNMDLTARKERESAAQHLANDAATTRYGAICEK